MLERLFGTGSSSTLIEAAFRDLSGMLDQAGEMLDLSLTSVLDNQPLEVDLEAMDDVVDEGERMVRRTVLEHLTVNPKHDLVASLVLVSMVQDAERLGDFAHGFAELARLAKQPRSGSFRDDLAALARRVRPLFAVCREAFVEDDADKARQVIQAHTSIKEDLGAYTRRVADSQLDADLAVVYAVGARILRRISAHLANIASSVVQPYDRIRHGDEDA